MSDERGLFSVFKALTRDGKVNHYGRVQLGNKPKLYNGCENYEFVDDAGAVTLKVAQKLVYTLNNELRSGKGFEPESPDHFPPKFDQDAVIDDSIPVDPFERKEWVSELSIEEIACAFYLIIARWDCDDGAACDYLFQPRSIMANPIIQEMVSAASAEQTIKAAGALKAWARNTKNPAATSVLMFRQKARAKWSDKAGDLAIGAVNSDDANITFKVQMITDADQLEKSNYKAEDENKSEGPAIH